MLPHPTRSTACGPGSGFFEGNAIPITLVQGSGEWVWDSSGNRYLDFQCGALAHGHCHPRLVRAAQEQLTRLTHCSSSLSNSAELAWSSCLGELSGFEAVLPQSGEDETLSLCVSLAQRWAELTKGLSEHKARIISAETGSSLEALEGSLRSETAALILEPPACHLEEAMPTSTHLKQIQLLCRDRGTLLILNETLTGLSRTGRTFAFEYENVRPDVLIVGGSLGGGIVPISALCTRPELRDLLPATDALPPFPGKPLACAISHEALRVLQDERFNERSRRLGYIFRAALGTLPGRIVREVRGKGLLVTIELQREAGPAREYALRLAARGILVETQGRSCLRFLPPLTIDEDHLLWACEIICETLSLRRLSELNAV